MTMATLRTTTQKKWYRGPSTMARPLLCLALSTTSSLVGAQPPRDVHPWLTDCGEHGCFVGWFCAPSSDLCRECPRISDGGETTAGGGVTEDHCRGLLAPADDDDDGAFNATALRLDVEGCVEGCVRPQTGDPCADDVGCDPGRSFCNYRESPEDPADDGTPRVAEEDGRPTRREGTCAACPDDVQSCLDDPDILSPFGVEACVLCDIGVCVPLHFSVAAEVDAGGTATVVASAALQGSPSAAVRGEVADCGNLARAGERTCVPGGNGLPPEATRLDGRVCLVRLAALSTYLVDVVDKCARLGGVAAVLFQRDPRVPDDEPWTGSLSYQPTTIPSVVVSYDDGVRWERERLREVAAVNVTDVGKFCEQRQFCSDDVPCVGSSAGRYCDYKWGGGDGGNGFCRDCPVDDHGDPDPLQCFFDTNNSDGGKAMGQSGVESCAATCAGSLEFPSCKFCPEDIGGFDFGLQGDDDQKCRFCPDNDVLYPEKEFPMFGEGVECWMVQKFFDSVDVKADARNCELAQMMNYVCGCSGSGYLGADTKAKQAVLAWLPRISSMLSILGSAFIVRDTTKSRQQRKRVNKQLLFGLSVFDILGACGYAFTTLPIPEDHAYGPIYGARGNEATCTTQGIFIQLGTISAYLNVSLAVYYYLVIKHGWEERRLKKIRWTLFVVPMAVGFAWVFAGIPFYDNLNLWCNNAASYWPDIPVAVAIGLATVIMALVCWDVYATDRASEKWRGGARATNSSSQTARTSRMSMTSRASRDGHQSLSSQVFWQSFFYLMAFYLTWPPYLALQYAWAGGSSFTNYGLILTAATLVPLQGFWNMLVYIRPRYLQKRQGR